MAENPKPKRSRNKPGKRNRGKAQQYNEKLQPLLDMLPYGPVTLANSKTKLQHYYTSVQSKDYPLLPPPYRFCLTAVCCERWTTRVYQEATGLVVRCSKLKLSYTYELVNKTYCMPLVTTTEKEVISIQAGTTTLFTTYPVLTRQGSDHFRQLSEKCESMHRRHLCLRLLHTGKKPTTKYRACPKHNVVPVEN